MYISICINMSNAYIYVYINIYIFFLFRLKHMYADKCIQTHMHTYKQCMYIYAKNKQNINAVFAWETSDPGIISSSEV